MGNKTGPPSLIDFHGPSNILTPKGGITMRWSNDTRGSHSCRNTGVVHVLDELGDLLGAVIHCEQLIVDSEWCLEREEK